MARWRGGPRPAHAPPIPPVIPPGLPTIRQIIERIQAERLAQSQGRIVYEWSFLCLFLDNDTNDVIATHRFTTETDTPTQHQRASGDARRQARNWAETGGTPILRGRTNYRIQCRRIGSIIGRTV